MACLPTPRHGLCSGVGVPLPFSPDRHCYRTSHPLRRPQQGSLGKHPASPCLPPLGCPPPLPTSQSPCEGGKGLPPAVLQQQQPCRKIVGMLAWGGTHRLGRDLTAGIQTGGTPEVTPWRGSVFGPNLVPQTCAQPTHSYHCPRAAAARTVHVDGSWHRAGTHLQPMEAGRTVTPT